MRIENSLNRNNSNTFQKKNKLKKSIKEQNVLTEEINQIDISSEVLILSRLLDAPEHRYFPLPFYFPNTALRNTQHASTIAKSIQQKAIYQGVDLNYEMILDLVLSHSNETASRSPHFNAINNMQNFQHIPLRNEEAQFFESFHKNSIEKNITPEVIHSLVMEYSQQMKTKNTQFINTRKQTQQLKWIINNTVNSDILNNKQPLISALEEIHN